MQEARKASDAKMVKILGASLKLPESSHWTGSSSVKRYLEVRLSHPTWCKVDPLHGHKVSA